MIGEMDREGSVMGDDGLVGEVRLGIDHNVVDVKVVGL